MQQAQVEVKLTEAQLMEIVSQSEYANVMGVLIENARVVWEKNARIVWEKNARVEWERSKEAEMSELRRSMNNEW
jgi:hypothetical protein